MVGFLFGGTTNETAESLSRKRKLIDELQAQIMGATPKTAQEGWGAVLKGIGAGIGKYRLDKQEKAARDDAVSRFQKVAGDFFSANYGGNNLLAPSSPSQAPTAPQSSTGPATGGLMSDFMAPIRETVKNPFALAAIASTGNAESGFDPAKANARWADPSQSGQPGTAGGVMSWRNDRLRALEDYAKLNGEDPSKISAGTQGKFFLQEDPNLITALNGAKSVEEAQGLMDNAWKFAGYDKPSQERANRLSSARNYLSAFQPTETASLDPMAGASNSALSYANSGAIRNQPVVEGLAGNLQQAVADVYGPGARVEVYSGGQPGKGEKGARTGSVRHDHGRAADVRVYGADGKQISGDALAPLGQYWRAKGLGGVGMEMHGGGIHLDDWVEPPPGGGMSWNYADQGGTYTPQMAAAIEAGGKGVMPTLYAPPQQAGGNAALEAINAQMQPQGSAPLGYQPAPALPPATTVSTPPSPPADPTDQYAEAIRARGGNPNVGIFPVIAGRQGEVISPRGNPNSPFIPKDMRPAAPAFGGTAQGEPMERMRAAQGGASSQQPQQVAQAGPDVGRTAGWSLGELYGLASNTMLPEEYRAQAKAMIEMRMAEMQSQREEQNWRARKAWERQEQQNDPAYQTDLQYKQAQLKALSQKPEDPWEKLDDKTLYRKSTGETKSIGGNASGAFRFSGNSVEAQALNGLIDSKQLTPEQAQQLAAGKQITNPADGSIIFMTPQGIFGQPANGGPAQPIGSPQADGIDIFAGAEPSRTAPPPASSPSSPFAPASATPPGAIQLTPGKAQMPTEATRNRAANVDQAFSTITGELDRYASLVKDHGIEVAPGEARDNMNSVRQGIMLQLKELFNLGVLNGPDLGLMERMIYDPVVDVTKEGGITNLPSQLWDATTGAAEGRANNSVAELKRMLGNIKQSVDGSLAGQRTGGQPTDSGWKDVDGIKIRRK